MGMGIFKTDDVRASYHVFLKWIVRLKYNGMQVKKKQGHQVTIFILTRKTDDPYILQFIKTIIYRQILTLEISINSTLCKEKLDEWEHEKYMLSRDLTLF